MSDPTAPTPPAQPQQPAYAQPTEPYPGQAPYQGAPPQPGAAPQVEKAQRNVLGIIALAVSAVGFIFACVPGALIVGWVLLPIGFILGIVSLFMKGKVKWQGITAIIVSVVGTIVGIIVFTVVVATAFNDSFGGTDVGIGEEPAVVEEAEGPVAPIEEEEAEPAAEVGTRENPAPLGTPIEGQEWTVVINSVTFGATDQILAENQFNEAPDPGTEYILINYTATYTGDDPEGMSAIFASVEYVTADGVTVTGFDKVVVGPDEIDVISTLYNGGSVTGNKALQVPSPPDGVIAVSPGMISDTVFVATQ